ncbi:MAG TPA: EF-P beta-lysylation protein EpmB, partial [Gammaproteobacteria bacterium]|nr:EF-P beta-lysylation protein EpmB [Gammaproteobacteria bacterium]
MEKANPHDPLLRQVLPLGDELVPTPGFKTDPVGDLNTQLAPGLLQKYAGRVLLVATGACAVHCRYCFRRHFPYGDENPRRGQWRAALDAIQADNTIKEVILSGGDPLSLNDEHLSHLVNELAAIPHLIRLRIHTRQPVVLPERVDDNLLAWLHASRLQKVVVIHSNHAQEIDSRVSDAINHLRRADCTVLNQAVLLRGVNDSAAVLANLSETLFKAGVMPYYLHLLDKVAGAAHFDVPESEAQDLMRTLRATLPGYLVPQLAREIAGEDSKRLVGY